MTEQMTPDLMRQIAKRLRSAFDTDEWTMVGAGADALDRLAEVIEQCEIELDVTGDPLGLQPGGQVARAILRTARGEVRDVS